MNSFSTINLNNVHSLNQSTFILPGLHIREGGMIFFIYIQLDIYLVTGHHQFLDTTTSVFVITTIVVDSLATTIFWRPGF